MHITKEYAERVITGKIKSCKNEWLACNRHLKDLQNKEWEYVFDESRANRIYDWFERCCRHVRGVYAGQLIELSDWQKFDLGVKYGWVNKYTGQRRFKKAFELRARGNVKSTEKSAEALYFMCADALYSPQSVNVKLYENMPEVDCAAVDRSQARRIWGDARDMALNSPEILKRLTVKKTYIEHRTRGGSLRPLSKDTKNKDGGAPCFVIIDEYHAHLTSEIHDVCYSSFGKRSQSLLNIISTAGTNAENNPCKKEYDICVKILNGEIVAEDYFIMIRELDKEDNPHDSGNWIKANPILQIENEYAKELSSQIKSEHEIAYNSGDNAKIREWLIKRCNVWQSISENSYMSECMDDFKKAGIDRNAFKELVKGKECFVGLDLSKRIDLTACGYVFPLEDGRFGITAQGFIPEDCARKHELTDRVPYIDWAKDDWCKLTPGNVIDYNFIKQYIYDNELDEGWKIKEVCYDPYNAEHFTQELEAKGYTRIEIRQGVQTLSEPIKRFRELVMQGKIIHDNNPLLVWCISNAIEVADNNGNIKLNKRTKDDSQRIDLLAAIINACVRAFAVEENKKTIYRERGVITV